jgi:hypothetical protein
MPVRSAKCILFLLVFVAARTPPQCQLHAESQPCAEVVTDMVPGLNARLFDRRSLSHVEVRQCDSLGGAMQVVAWKGGSNLPSVVLNIARFSLGPLLMDGNVFVMVFPGPYDSIVVVQYHHGEPKVVFTDSTHAEIFLATARDRVVVTLDYGKGKKTVKTFKVDETQLSPPA